MTCPRCPRCAGQLYRDDDCYGRYLSCLNCGYLLPLDHYEPDGKRDNTRYASGRPRKARLRGQTVAQRHPRA